MNNGTVTVKVDRKITEAMKYRKVWDHPEYRRVSPGELEQDHAWKALGCRAGMTLNDYGSGPARATKWFQQRGLDVLGIDHASNAAETDVPVLTRCLWDMGDVRTSDFAYCCDVMEHIPPEHVDEVLDSIAALTHRAAYFRIATRPDKMGPKLIGEPLHLTVLNGDEWNDKLSQAFPVVGMLRCDGKDAVFVCRV